MDSKNDSKNGGFVQIGLDNMEESNGVKEPLNESYDPHKFRNNSEGTSNFQALVHLLKGCLGTGILAMPFAFKNAGILTGVAVTFFSGFICTYCLHILVRMQYILCKHEKVPILTYADTMRIATSRGPLILRPYGNLFGHLANGFLLAYQMGICSVYIVFVAVSMNKVLIEFLEFQSPFKFSYELIIVAVLCPIMLIRNLKKLAPLSTVANALILTGFGIIFYFIFRESLPDISERNMVGPVTMLPSMFGTALFALEAIGVFASVESEMRKPKDFYRVIDFGMIIVTFLYAFMGVVGYWKYGEGIHDSITLDASEEELIGKCLKLVLALAILFSYPLQCYVSVDLIWKTWIKKSLDKSDASETKKAVYQNLLRICTVIITLLPAILVPNLGVLISLCGALCLSVLGIAFPALIEICTLWPDKLGRYRWMLYKNIILIILGLFAMVSGTYYALKDVV